MENEKTLNRLSAGLALTVGAIWNSCLTGDTLGWNQAAGFLLLIAVLAIAWRLLGRTVMKRFERRPFRMGWAMAYGYGLALTVHLTLWTIFDVGGGLRETAAYFLMVLLISHIYILPAALVVGSVFGAVVREIQGGLVPGEAKRFRFLLAAIIPLFASLFLFRREFFPRMDEPCAPQLLLSVFCLFGTLYAALIFLFYAKFLQAPLQRGFVWRPALVGVITAGWSSWFFFFLSITISGLVKNLQFWKSGEARAAFAVFWAHLPRLLPLWVVLFIALGWAFRTARAGAPIAASTT